MAALVGNIKGPQGDQGPPGPPGAANAVYTGEWVWTTKTTDAATSGQVGTNDAGWAPATQVNINKQRADNTDVSLMLVKVKISDQLRLQVKTDGTRWATYEVTGPGTDNGTWWSYPVTYVETGGTPPNGNTPTLISLLTDGRSVEEWDSGPGAPVSTQGNIGDWWLDETSGDVWEKTADTVWTLRTNITGPGVPTGGTAGQVLAKDTTTDYDTSWIDPPAGGGTVTDVVWVGPDAPVEPTTELWYDTDAPSTGGGSSGVGVPPGGTAGQVLTKNSTSDYDTSWADPQITVSSTAPTNPTPNDLWVDTS